MRYVILFMLCFCSDSRQSIRYYTIEKGDINEFQGEKDFCGKKARPGC